MAATTHTLTETTHNQWEITAKRGDASPHEIQALTITVKSTTEPVTLTLRSRVREDERGDIEEITDRGLIVDGRVVLTDEVKGTNQLTLSESGCVIVGRDELRGTPWIKYAEDHINNPEAFIDVVDAMMDEADLDD